MNIQCERDLRHAYELLRIYEEICKVDSVKVKELKAQIRAYVKTSHEKHIVKDEGVDGYIELVSFPDFLDTFDKEEVEDWFKEYRVLELHSAFGCTGRPFTVWFKVFRRQGRWAAYHYVAFDV